MQYFMTANNVKNETNGASKKPMTALSTNQKTLCNELHWVVNPCPVESGLKSIYGWGVNNMGWESIPGLNHPVGEKILTEV